MNSNINELKDLILEKNVTLDNLNCNERPDKRKIKQAEHELDKLLYKFYKGYINKYTLH